MPVQSVKEPLVMYGSSFLINKDGMTPTRRHQLYEEVMKAEKEFAAMIYFQRDMEGRYP